MLVLLLELIIKVVVLLADLVDLFAEDLYALAGVGLPEPVPKFANPEECMLAAIAFSDLSHEVMVPSAVLEFTTVVDEVGYT